MTEENKEVWLPIPGYKYYEASSHGRVRSVDRTRPNGRWPGKTQRVAGKMLKQISTSQKYLVVGVYTGENRNGYKTRTIRIHVLVAKAFLGPRPEKNQIAHLNGDPTDNRLENLKYCTPKENESHKYTHGTRGLGELATNNKLTNKCVLKIREMASQKIPHKQIAKKFKISEKYVGEVFNRRKWTHI